MRKNEKSVYFYMQNFKKQKLTEFNVSKVYWDIVTYASGLDPEFDKRVNIAATSRSIELSVEIFTLRTGILPTVMFLSAAIVLKSS